MKYDNQSVNLGSQRLMTNGPIRHQSCPNECLLLALQGKWTLHMKNKVQNLLKHIQKKVNSKTTMATKSYTNISTSTITPSL